MKSRIYKFNEFKKINEGSWSLPFTEDKVDELEYLMKQPIDPEVASDLLYDIFGDDDLFDNIAHWQDDGADDVRILIKDKLKEYLQQYKENPDSFRTKIKNKELFDRLWKIATEDSMNENFSSEEQKNWSETKSKLWDAYANASNKLDDLKDELKMAKKRGDKEDIKEIQKRIKIAKHKVDWTKNNFEEEK